MGAVLLLLCMLGLGLSLVTAMIVPTAVYFSAAAPGDYDDWKESGNREAGDTYRVRGKISAKEFEKVDALDFEAWKYKFVGSDQPFYSKNEIGQTGDWMVLNLELEEHQWWIVKLLLPWVTLKEPYQVCGLPCCCMAVLLLVVAFAGIAMTVFGGGRKKKGPGQWSKKD